MNCNIICVKLLQLTENPIGFLNLLDRKFKWISIHCFYCLSAAVFLEIIWLQKKKKSKKTMQQPGKKTLHKVGVGLLDVCMHILRGADGKDCRMCLHLLLLCFIDEFSDPNRNWWCTRCAGGGAGRREISAFRCQSTEALYSFPACCCCPWQMAQIYSKLLHSLQL